MVSKDGPHFRPVQIKTAGQCWKRKSFPQLTAMWSSNLLVCRPSSSNSNWHSLKAGSFAICSSSVLRPTRVMPSSRLLMVRVASRWISSMVWVVRALSMLRLSLPTASIPPSPTTSLPSLSRMKSTALSSMTSVSCAFLKSLLRFTHRVRCALKSSPSTIFQRKKTGVVAWPLTPKILAAQNPSLWLKTHVALVH